MNQNKTDRRQFLAGTMGAAVALGVTQRVQSADSKPKQQFYELRIYRTPSADKQAIISNYLEQALLPALKRAGMFWKPTRNITRQPPSTSLFQKSLPLSRGLRAD